MIYKNIFNRLISSENLFLAWDQFKVGKSKKTDVMEFEMNLEQNIFHLAKELKEKTYAHGAYMGFFITDPKLRHIHKATVRDRILHHAVYNALNPVFEPTFIHDSYSCRIGKGSHKGVEAVSDMLRKVSRNNTRKCFALKCDIKKFFDSVDQEILLFVLKSRIKDPDVIWLMQKLTSSYDSRGAAREREREREMFGASRQTSIGIPIGNLTSQLFANVYMNEFDQFVKHSLRVKNYARYTDDFIIVSDSYEYLENLLPKISDFLKDKLKLELHPEKILIRKYHQGVDFLGYVIFPNHRLVRKRTVKRIYRKLKEKTEKYKIGQVSEETLTQTLKSYEGVLSHANTFRFLEKLKNAFWLWLK